MLTKDIQKIFYARAGVSQDGAWEGNISIFFIIRDRDFKHKKQYFHINQRSSNFALSSRGLLILPQVFSVGHFVSTPAQTPMIAATALVLCSHCNIDYHFTS